MDHSFGDFPVICGAMGWIEVRTNAIAAAECSPNFALTRKRSKTHCETVLRCASVVEMAPALIAAQENGPSDEKTSLPSTTG